jgi:hypothetical protein
MVLWWGYQKESEMKRTLLSTVALLAGLAMVQTTPAQAQNAGQRGDQGFPTQSGPTQGSLKSAVHDA